MQPYRQWVNGNRRPAAGEIGPIRPLERTGLQRGKAMFEASLNFRKAILGSASVLAISMATPAFAQDAPAAPSSDQPPPPKVTPNQI